ncbi:type II toxin-antitoxin system RelE/ParE family toxin [Alkalilimnicola ehrlichii]|uniref:type II toxin-antitoxin system RelE/ParE family toxin n=1 Tax=Alkalilimnicola ehrlichii TaxID=351052 RepID=UPI00216392B0|nr:type II toxin-antitoxin system RelE/ParE family toxin [Alkalilimnicola ehrlichii]
MAYQVAWSPEAVEDVEEIAAYIEKDSPQYAQAVADRIVAYSRRLNHLPLRGRVVPELDDPSYREGFYLQLPDDLPRRGQRSADHRRDPRQASADLHRRPFRRRALDRLPARPAGRG